MKSEWQQAKDTQGVLLQTHIGGQALLEGIMMRGRYNWAIAVRRPDGTIYTEEHDLVSGRPRNSWMYWPVIRGCTALVESFALSYQALQVSSENAFMGLEESDAADEGDAGTSPQGITASDESGETEAIFSIAVEDDDDDGNLPKPLITATLILGMLLGMGIFVALPALLTNLLVGDYGQRTLLWNLVDGAIRIVIFVLYIWLIGRMPDIKRVFGYHGAEHKTIHCYEHGRELLPENADVFPTLHVRCGTAFMLMTMLIAILVFTLVPIGLVIESLHVTNPILRFLIVLASRIVLIPLVAGLAYEVTVKWAGSHPENRLVQFVLWPGMQLQRLTTNQPDVGQLECAIAAMQLVLAREIRETEATQASS